MTDVLEFVSERTSNKAALVAALKGRAEKESSRLIGAVEGVFLRPRTNSPILESILQGSRACHPGKTYIIVSKSQNGKSAAVKDFVANCLGNDRNGLYINAGKYLNVVRSLKKVLNTTVDGPDIASALVTALGAQQAGKNKAPSFLVIDEVDVASGEGEAPVENASFVRSLFMEVAEEENITCIVVSSKEKTADYLLQLNGGKIRPFPGFARANWDANEDQPTGWIDFSWTVAQLRALLDFKFGSAAQMGVIDYSFLRDGMTPGDAVSHVKHELAAQNFVPPLV
jgi:hypothetical protein